MSTNENNLLALISSAVLILVGILLQSVSQLGERIVIARAYSPGVYGEFTMGLAVMTIATTLAMVGLNQGIPRFVSRYDDDREKRGIWFVAIIWASACAVVVAAVLYLNLDRIAVLLFGTHPPIAFLRLFVLAIPLNVVLLIGVGTLRGLENTRYKVYAEDILRPSSRLLLVLVFIASGYGIVAVGWAYVASVVLSLLVTYCLVNRLLPLVGPVRTHTHKLITYSLPLILTMLLTVLLTQTDTLMLGYFRSSRQVGFYNAAYPLSNALLLIISAFGYLYLPQVSRLDAEEKRGEIASTYRLITKWGYVVTFPAFAAFVAFPSDIVSMFFGANYAPGGIALAVLSIGFFTSAAAGRNRATLLAFGDNTPVLVADASTITLNVALNLALIPRYGFVGTAVATTCAYVVRNVVISAFLYQRYGISPFSRRLVKTYVSLPVVLLPLSFAFAAIVSLTVVSLTVVSLLAFLVGTGLVALVVVGVTGCFQPEDAIILTYVEDAIGVDLNFFRQLLPVRTKD